jgi:hypothetical protein
MLENDTNTDLRKLSKDMLEICLENNVDPRVYIQNKKEIDLGSMAKDLYDLQVLSKSQYAYFTQKKKAQV